MPHSLENAWSDRIRSALTERRPLDAASACGARAFDKVDGRYRDRAERRNLSNAVEPKLRSAALTLVT
jgi:hypothetical protein